MRVLDLQEFLSSFTASNKEGTRQGNAVSNAVLMVEVNGRLHDIRRMEVQENSTPILGHPRSLKHVHMYRGSRILDLVEQGLKLDACSLGLDACRLMLNQVGSKA